MSRLNADSLCFPTLEENLGNDVIQGVPVSQTAANDAKWITQKSPWVLFKTKDDTVWCTRAVLVGFALIFVTFKPFLVFC